MTFLFGALALLKRVPWPVYAGLALLICVAGVIHVHNVQVADARVEGRKAGIAEATDTFKANQEAADGLARARVVAISKAQAAISKGSSDDFAKTSADIDRRAGLLRVQHDTAVAAYDHQRIAGGGYLSPIPIASDEPAPAPADQCVPFATALPAFTEAERNTAQLIAILDWTDRQEAQAAKPH